MTRSSRSKAKWARAAPFERSSPSRASRSKAADRSSARISDGGGGGQRTGLALSLGAKPVENRAHSLHEIRRNRPASAIAPCTPDRIGEMRIIAETRDDVPMQVGNDVAEARQVDLVRLQHIAKRLLHGKNPDHESRS